MSKKNLVVKYDNRLHQINFDKLDTEAHLNAFFALMAIMKNTESNVIELSYAEFFRLIRVEEQGADYKKRMINVVKDLAGKYYYHQSDRGFSVITIFNRIDGFDETRMLKFRIEPDFRELYLENIKNQFTRYELDIFLSLSGVYTKTIFRHLMQFKSGGVWSISYENFRKLLNIPESYKSCEIDTRVIKPAIKNLSKYFEGLMIRKIKDGRKIKTLQWIYSPQKYNAKLQNAKKQELSLEYIATKMKQEEMVKNVKDSTKAKEVKKQIESLIQAKTIQNTEDHNIELLKSYKGRVVKITRPEDERSDDFRIIEFQLRKPDGKIFLRCQNTDSPDEIIFGGTDGFENAKHAINFIQKHLV